MKKNIIIVIILLSIFLLLSCYSYANSVSEELSSSVFRLHVIANSDLKEDQSLKYKVRDELIKYMNTLVTISNTKKEVIEIAHSHLEDFKNIAESVISQNGYNYPVSVEIGNYEFPTKSYGDIKFPAGYYDALRVKIGNSQGQNWWCVMFPPLCFVDVTSGIVPDSSKEELKSSLSLEDYSIISNKDNATNIKFKIVEFFKNIEYKIAQK